MAVVGITLCATGAGSGVGGMLLVGGVIQLGEAIHPGAMKALISGIATGIGKIFHASPETVQILRAILGVGISLSLALATALATGGVGGILMGIGTFGSTVGSTGLMEACFLAHADGITQEDLSVSALNFDQQKQLAHYESVFGWVSLCVGVACCVLGGLAQLWKGVSAEEGIVAGEAGEATLEETNGIQNLTEVQEATQNGGNVRGLKSSLKRGNSRLRSWFLRHQYSIPLTTEGINSGVTSTTSIVVAEKSAKVGDTRRDLDYIRADERLCEQNGMRIARSIERDAKQGMDLQRRIAANQVRISGKLRAAFEEQQYAIGRMVS